MVKRLFTDPQTGTATAEDWHAVNWQLVNDKVVRLQFAIAKAVREGKWRKVRCLQAKLVHSFYAKLLAVRRVTENRGKKTPGVDGELWSSPEAKLKAAKRLTDRNYRAKPLRRVWIPKRNGKLRPLGIPTMYDRAMQALYLLALEPVSETRADGNSYGFRPKRAARDAIEQAFSCLSRKVASQWILEADIKGFFDNINHDWILRNIPLDKKVLRQWLKSGVINGKVFEKTEAGTPQGGIISPTIANMVLDGLEKVIQEIARVRRTRLNFIRYADDFIVTGRSSYTLSIVKDFIKLFLRQRGVQLSEEKTKITHIDQGFDFLGFNLRKYNGKLLIKPSKSSLTDLWLKVRGIFREGRTLNTDVLIRRLNPVLRGWANYYRHVASKSTFRQLDNLLWIKSWRWATRRHPKKNRNWIKRKYYPRIGSNNWILCGEHQRLYQIARVPIKRHVKIAQNANPFDPAFEEYFEQRNTLLWDHSNRDRKFISVFHRQSGRCLVCKQPIELDTRYDVHHIKPVTTGGRDTLNNLALLHPDCHRLIHAQFGTAIPAGVFGLFSN